MMAFASFVPAFHAVGNFVVCFFDLVSNDNNHVTISVVDTVYVCLHLIPVAQIWLISEILQEICDGGDAKMRPLTARIHINQMVNAPSVRFVLTIVMFS